MSFKELVIADQRLVILRSLEEMPGYEANESILDSCLDQYGHKVSRDAVRTHISWLAEQGLVAVRELGNTMIAKLNSRGIDVANGSATVPGVKKPRPE